MISSGMDGLMTCMVKTDLQTATMPVRASVTPREVGLFADTAAIDRGSRIDPRTTCR